MSEENKRLITYFEEEFDCSGLCNKNLFFWMKSISEGKPEKACFKAFWDRVGILCEKLGTPPAFTSILLLFAIILNYPLCGYDHEEWMNEIEKAEKERKDQEKKDSMNKSKNHFA